MRPRIKGDTIEFNTEHALMQPNAVVEELLRRLPGIHVAPDGTVTYNGQKIQHLLVDGQDIFGSDPTMVTRNFDASKIAQVQILDRKSDQAIFTGIDDGARTKTLNLVMKESAKNGYFGKLEAGGNLDDYYMVNGALAAFREKEQFTAQGLVSNVGSTGFTGVAGGSATGITFMSGNSDALNASAGAGIPRFEAAAVHYANIWNGQKDHLTNNYQYSYYYTKPVTMTQTYEALPDSIYGQNQQSHSVNQQGQHWTFGVYDCTSNTSAIKFAFHAINSQGQSQFNSSDKTTFNDTLVNNSERTIQDKSSNLNIGGNLSWRTRIGKRTDRVFSAKIGAIKIDNTTNGYLYSLTQFYPQNPIFQSQDTVDQRKQIENHELTFNAGMTYAEPLWKSISIGFSYSLSTGSNNPLQATFGRGDGKYLELIDSLSNDFRIRTIDHLASVNLQGHTGNLTFAVGANWLGHNYRQLDLISDTLFHVHYSNLAPRALLIYKIDQTTDFHFNYGAFSQQPTVAQLTPITNNNDPLHISLGDPNLKSGFRQDFKLEFHRYKTLLINFYLDLTINSNDISTKTVTDGLGQQISQPVNVDGSQTAELNFSINRIIAGFDLSFATRNTYSQSVNYVNSDLSRNDAYSIGGGFGLDKYLVDKYALVLVTNFSHFDQVSSINPSAPVHYWTQIHQGSLTIYTIRNFEINTSASFTWQERTGTFGSSTSLLLWNSFISRNFLKNNKLTVRLQVNNILDRNAGISRSNQANVNTESFTNILGRYWMFSVIYHYDKAFKWK